MEKLTSGKKTRKKISFASEKERKTEETRRISLNVMDRFARTRHRQTRTQTKEREREKGERERERCSRRNCIVYSAWVKCQIGKCQKMMEGSCLWACLLPAVCAKVAHRLGCTLLIRNSNQATGLNSRKASGIHLLASDFHFTGKSRKQTDKCDSSSHNSQISTKLAKDKSNCTYHKHRIGYSNNNN